MAQRPSHKDEWASHHSRQSTTPASKEDTKEVNLDLVKAQDNSIRTQCRKVSQKFNQFIVDRAEKERQKALRKVLDKTYNKCDEQQNRIASSVDNAFDLPNTPIYVPGSTERVSTNSGNNIQENTSQSAEFEDTPGKLHNSRSDNGKQKNKGIRVQNDYTYDGSLDRQRVCSIQNTSSIRGSIAGENFSKDSSYRYDVTQSGNISQHNMLTQSSTLQSFSTSECTIKHGNISPHNMHAPSSTLHGSSSSESAIIPGNISPDNMHAPSSTVQGSSSSGHTMKPGNISLYNVPAQSSTLKEENPSSYTFEGNNLTAVLATHACSEQSDKHINPSSKKSSSNGKLQIKKNRELEVLDKVETSPLTSVVLQSDLSHLENPSYPPTDWEMVETDPHVTESHVAFAAESSFLDSSSHQDLRNVHLDDFENQSASISREEQQEGPFLAKGNVIADWLRKLPEKQSNEAEKQIAHIILKLNAEARQEKPQDGNLYKSDRYTRQCLPRMCKDKVPSDQKLPSPGKGEVRLRKDVRFQSTTNRRKLYKQLPEELNGNMEEQEEIDPSTYDWNSYNPNPVNEQEYDEDEQEYDENEQEYEEGEQVYEEEPENQVSAVPVNNPVHLLKKVRSVPECEKWPGSRKAAQRPKEKISSSPPPVRTYKKEVQCVLLVILVAVAAIIAALFLPKILEMILKLNAPPPVGVATIVENLKRDFVEQHPMTYKIVNNALSKVTEPNPKAPAIIVLLAELGAEEIASQFARKIARSVSLSGDIVVISGHTYHSEDHDVAKKDIDDLIKENLRESELGAVLVERLDYIPAEAAMIFHTYCDHENALFKRAVYVMTIASKATQLKSYEPKDWDTMVQDHLSESWSTGGNDQVSSLLARLTVSVAAIVSGG